MDQALATAPMRWRVLRSTNTGYNHAGSLRGFKATASSCSNSQTAHATHSTPSPPHSRQDHETPTSPQTPDNKLHHRHAKVFKPPLRQTPPIVDQPPPVPLLCSIGTNTRQPLLLLHTPAPAAHGYRGGLRLGTGSFPVALRPRLASTSRRTPSRHLAASARGPAIRYGTCSLGPTGC